MAGSNPSRRAAECNVGQDAYTHVPVTITGGDARWLGRWRVMAAYAGFMASGVPYLTLL